MTNQELIEELQKLDPDAVAKRQAIDEDGYAEYWEIETVQETIEYIGGVGKKAVRLS